MGEWHGSQPAVLGVVFEAALLPNAKLVGTSRNQVSRMRSRCHEKLRYFMDSQVAQNRTAKSYDQGSTFDSKDPPRG